MNVTDIMYQPSTALKKQIIHYSSSSVAVKLCPQSCIVGHTTITEFDYSNRFKARIFTKADYDNIYGSTQCIF